MQSARAVLSMNGRREDFSRLVLELSLCVASMHENNFDGAGERKGKKEKKKKKGM